MSATADTKPPEALEGEVVTDTSEGGAPGGTRALRVYDPRGDFQIDIPSEGKVTFGYFNPAAPREVGQNRYGHSNGMGAETMRTTCLRVYADNTDKTQLAAFLGVTGFRDLRIKKTSFKQSVTITHNFEDDGVGEQRVNELARKALVISTEDDIPF